MAKISSDPSQLVSSMTAHKKYVLKRQINFKGSILFLSLGYAKLNQSVNQNNSIHEAHKFYKMV